MTHFKAVLLLIISSSLLACQPGTETIREVVREPMPSPAYSNNAQGGVDDGGGGNGLEGRPLESYAVEVKNVPSFTNFILPIIKKVQAVHPRFASDMMHIALNRTWYLIPGELQKIPSQIIGVSFSDEKLQQIARHNLSAVWINSKLFDAMPSEEDRAILILHEILMGIRFMKYKNALDNCYSEIAYLTLDESQAAPYRKLRDTCALEYGFATKDSTILPGVKSINLSKADYDNIRELVLHVWREKGEISKVELDAWLKDKDFRRY